MLRIRVEPEREATAMIQKRLTKILASVVGFEEER
jgi:hypothetical protein